MSLKNTLQFILNHPLNKDNKIKALMRFVKWQLKSRMSGGPVVSSFAERSKLIVWNGLTGATGNIYCGLHEFNDMAFLLHFLRKEDLFVDVGANIGSYTILSASEVGAKTISVEPVPRTFNYLLDNIRVNKIEALVEALNIGLSGEEGTLNFTSGFDTVNHVVTNINEDTIKVVVSTFDKIVGTQKPVLVKIDVEGFEAEVLKGMNASFADNVLRAVIIELNGSGKRYGFNEDDIEEKFRSYGFKPYQYDPMSRKLIELKGRGSDNTIFIRDLVYVENRLKTARKIKIFNKSI